MLPRLSLIQLVGNACNALNKVSKPLTWGFVPYTILLYALRPTVSRFPLPSGSCSINALAMASISSKVRGAGSSTRSSQSWRTHSRDGESAWIATLGRP
ncbi:hypothetical protein D3C74_376560 [compost metagenome]